MDPYYYNYTTSPSALDSTYVSYGTAATTGFVSALLIFFLILIVLAAAILVIIGRWKIFTKAGEEGWKSLIPIYAEYTMLKILSMEPLLCILYLLPVSNFFLNIVVAVKLAKSFKKGTGYAVGLFLLEPVFIPMLGFSNAKYSKLPSSR